MNYISYQVYGSYNNGKLLAEAKALAKMTFDEALAQPLVFMGILGL